jgi:hypothetical protein
VKIDINLVLFFMILIIPSFLKMDNDVDSFLLL